MFLTEVVPKPNIEEKQPEFGNKILKSISKNRGMEKTEVSRNY
jgi:hypothetical protein